MQVILCPNADLAVNTANTLKTLGFSFATVEAEYGQVVVEGSKATLAHHTGEWRANPAPCNTPVEQMLLEAVLVSHLDLDTVGGILRLELGSRDVLFTEDMVEFWQAAELADLNGPHKLPDLVSPEMLGLLQYVWSKSPRSPIVDRANPANLNVTETYQQWVAVIETVAGAVLEGETAELVAAGQAWAAEREQAVEKWFNAALSTPEVRVFQVEDPDDRVFCNANYRNADGSIAKAVVTMHPGALTISLESPIEGVDCAGIMQALFGPEAGGHKGIAGGPRNRSYRREDLIRVATAVKAAVTPVLV